MKDVIKELLCEFYAEGLPASVVKRDVMYYETEAMATASSTP